VHIHACGGTRAQPCMGTWLYYVPWPPQMVKSRLLAAAPEALVVDHFLGPQQLADIYRATLLNVHPCSYDAYGMTVVEAASQVGAAA
jgi:hypothetical protein